MVSDEEEKQRKLDEGRRMLEKFRQGKATPKPSPFSMARPVAPQKPPVRKPSQPETSGGTNTTVQATSNLKRMEAVPAEKKEEKPSISEGVARAHDPDISIKEMPNLPSTSLQSTSPQAFDKGQALQSSTVKHQEQPPQQQSMQADVAVTTVKHQEQPPQQQSMQADVAVTSGQEAQMRTAALNNAVIEPLDRVEAPAAHDAKPYLADGMVFTSYAAHTQRTSRTTYSIRREAGMRVDAMMGEVEGEGEKEIMIQSLRAMVDGFKHQMAADQDMVENALASEKLAKEQAKKLFAEVVELRQKTQEYSDELALAETTRNDTGGDHNAEIEDLKRQIEDLVQEKTALASSLAAANEAIHALDNAAITHERLLDSLNLQLESVKADKIAEASRWDEAKTKLRQELQALTCNVTEVHREVDSEAAELNMHFEGLFTEIQGLRHERDAMREQLTNAEAANSLESVDSLEKVTAENVMLSQQFQDLSIEIAATRAAADQEVSKMRAEMDELVSNIEMLNKEIQAYNTRLVEITAAKEQRDRDWSDAQALLADKEKLKVDCQELRVKLEHAESAARDEASHKGELASQIEELKQQLLDAESQKGAAETVRNSEQEQEIARLQDTNASLVEERNTLRGDIEAMSQVKEDNARLIKECNDLKADIEEVSRLQAANASLVEECNSLRGDIEEMSQVKEANASLTEEYNALKVNNEEISRLQAANASLTDECNALRRDIEELSQVKEGYTNLTEEYNTLKANIEEISRLQAANASLTEECNALRADIEKMPLLRDANASLTEECDALKADVEKMSSLQAANATLTEECNTLKENLEEMSQLRDANAKLTEQCHTLKANIDEIVVERRNEAADAAAAARLQEEKSLAEMSTIGSERDSLLEKLADAQNEIADLQKATDDLRKQCVDLQAQLSDSTANESIASEHWNRVQELEKSNAGLTEKLECAEEAACELEQQRKDSDAEVLQLQDELLSSQKKVHELTEEGKSLAKGCHDLRVTMECYKEEQESAQKELLSRLEASEEEISKLRAQAVQHRSAMDDALTRARGEVERREALEKEAAHAKADTLKLQADLERLKKKEGVAKSAVSHLQGQLRSEKSARVALETSAAEKIKSIKTEISASIACAETLRQVMLMQAEQSQTQQGQDSAQASQIAAEKLDRERAEAALHEAQQELELRSAQLESLRRGAALAGEAQAALEVAVTERISALNEELEDKDACLQERTEELERTKQESERKAAELSKALVESMADKQALQSVVDKAEQELKDLKAAHKQAVSELQKKCKSFDGQLREVSGLAEEASSECSNLRRQLQDSESERVQAAKAQTAYKDKAAGVIKDLNQRLEKAHAEKAEMVKSLDLKERELCKRVAELEQERSKAQSAVACQRQEFDKEKKDLNKLQKDTVAELQALRTESQSLNKKYEALQSQVSRLEEDKVDLSALLHEAKDQAKLAQGQVQELEQRFASESGECEAYKAQIAELRTVRSGLCEQLAMLQNQIQDERKARKLDQIASQEQHAHESREAADLITDLQRRLDAAEETISGERGLVMLADEEVRESQRSNEELREQVSQLDAQVCTLREQLQVWVSRESEMNEMRTKVEEMQGMREAAEEGRRAAEALCKQLEDTIQGLQEREEEQTQRQDKLEDEARGFASRLEAAKREKQSVEEQVKRLSCEFDALTCREQATSARCADLEERLARVSELADALVEDFKNEKTRADGLEKNLDRTVQAAKGMCNAIFGGQSCSSVVGTEDVQEICNKVVVYVDETREKLQGQKSAVVSEIADQEKLMQEIRNLKSELKKSHHKVYAAEASVTQSHAEALRREIGVRALCEEIKGMSDEIAGMVVRIKGDDCLLDERDQQVKKLLAQLEESDACRCRLEAACQVLRRGMELTNKEFQNIMLYGSSEVQLDPERLDLFADVRCMEGGGTPGKLVRVRGDTDVATTSGSVVHMVDCIGEHADAIQDAVRALHHYHDQQQRGPQ